MAAKHWFKNVTQGVAVITDRSVALVDRDCMQEFTIFIDISQTDFTANNIRLQYVCERNDI